MTKRLLTLALLAGVLCAQPAHAAKETKDADKAITIALVGPASGDNAYLGEQMKHGAEQAVADINAAGGVLGSKLALRFFDDACDPRQAVTVADNIVSAGIKFVVGHGCSSAAIAASRNYSEENVVMVTPSATNPALTEARSPYIFRTCGRDDQQGGAIAHFILDHYRGKKVAIVDNQSAWGRGIANEVKKVLDTASGPNSPPLFYDSYTGGERDFSALISELKEAKADVVFIGGFYTEVGSIVRQMKSQGANFQVIGGDALVSNSFWSITGAAGEGVLMTFSPDPRKVPGAKDTVEKLRKSGYEPEGYTLNTYAAVEVLAEGIKRARKPDPVPVYQSLHLGPIKTVIGDLSYNEKGDIRDASYVMYRWHDGKYAEFDDKKKDADSGGGVIDQNGNIPSNIPMPTPQDPHDEPPGQLNNALPVQPPVQPSVQPPANMSVKPQ